MEHERLTLRFPFIASAEIAPESAPNASIRATVKELSLRGCYMEAPAPFGVKTRVLLKIFVSDEYFEAKASVVYVHPMLGMDLAFREVKPNFRTVLQKWLLTAMQNKGSE